MIFLTGRQKKVNNPQRIANVCIIHAINVCVFSLLLLCFTHEPMRERRVVAFFNSLFFASLSHWISSPPHTLTPKINAIPCIWVQYVELHLISFYSFSTWHFYGVTYGYWRFIWWILHILHFICCDSKPRMSNWSHIFANEVLKKKKKMTWHRYRIIIIISTQQKNVPTHNTVCI